MSCSNTDIAPLGFSLSNVTLTDDGAALSYGVAIQIGTPPQTLSLTPSIALNNSFVNNVANCGSASNISCIAAIGGGYDPGASSTIRRSTLDSWNGSAENTENTYANTASLFFNDVLTIGNTQLPGFPALVQNSETQFYAGLGLGSNSTFIQRIIEAGLAPSNSWSLSQGVYSLFGSGSLIIGGYSEDLYEGELYSQNWTTDGTGLCPQCLELVNMTWTANGQDFALLPPTSDGSTFMGVVEPYYPLMLVPDAVSSTWGNITNGTWDPNVLSHRYDELPQGNLTMTLGNGLVTEIPSEALFNPPSFDNGALLDYRNGSTAIYSMVVPWETLYGTGAASVLTDIAMLGIPYTAYVYLIQDYERQTLSMAKAKQDAYGRGNIKTICPIQGRSEGGGTNTGAIAGGVVGGVVGLALIIGLIWFFLRKKNKKAAVEEAQPGGAVKPELAGDTTTPPQYSEQDAYAKKSHHLPDQSPATELPNQSAVSEIDGAATMQPRELPAQTKETPRVELPG